MIFRTARAGGAVLPLAALLCLSLLLAGCAGPVPTDAAQSSGPPPFTEAAPGPAVTPLPAPTPAPTMRVVNADGAGPSYAERYHEAVTAMRRCEFERAAALFEQLGGFSGSESDLIYCRSRMNAGPIPERERLLVDRNRLRDFPNGNLYAVPVGYLFVPFDCSEETRACVYFAGGEGEDYLFRRGVYHYLNNYQPNALMLFHYESCITHLDSGIATAVQVIDQVARECGIVLHDVITVGSSAGSFTALHAAVVMQRDYGIPVNAVLCLDAALEWIVDPSILFTDEECALLAERGTQLCLFEQEKALAYPEIRRMAERGCRVLVIACRHDDHNNISEYAYYCGAFSWGLEEIALDADEYTAFRIEA